MWVSAAFMLFVGMSMPAILGSDDLQHPAPDPASLHAAAPGRVTDDAALHGGVQDERFVSTITASQPSLDWNLIIFHTALTCGMRKPLSLAGPYQ